MINETRTFDEGNYLFGFIGGFMALSGAYMLAMVAALV